MLIRCCSTRTARRPIFIQPEALSKWATDFRQPSCTGWAVMGNRCRMPLGGEFKGRTATTGGGLHTPTQRANRAQDSRVRTQGTAPPRTSLRHRPG